MTSMFLDPLRVELISEDAGHGRPMWRLTDRLRFASALTHASGEPVGVVAVPPGFETDLASVPRLPAAWLIAGGVANRPAVIHDYLYVLGCASHPKLLADRLFAEGMAAEGIALWRRAVMYAAVRVGGTGAWAQAPQA
jgi:hypothetical protein